jgi:hypothetical protein
MRGNCRVLSSVETYDRVTEWLRGGGVGIECSRGEDGRAWRELYGAGVGKSLELDSFAGEGVRGAKSMRGGEGGGVAGRLSAVFAAGSMAEKGIRKRLSRLLTHEMPARGV